MTEKNFIDIINIMSTQSKNLLKLVNESLGKFSKCFKVRLYQGYGQYEEIWWIKLTPNTNMIDWKNSLKKEFQSVTAIHIMPYCITKEDAENSYMQYKNTKRMREKGRKPFNEITNNNFVDYDPATGNFHKKLDSNNQQVQIVLVEKGGPKWYKGTDDKNKIVRHNKYVVKSDWYFPGISNETNNKTQELELLLSEALHSILKTEFWQKIIM